MSHKSQELILRHELELRKARTEFLSFCLYVMPTFGTNWHIFKICDAVDELVFGDLDRLFVALPPQIGKLAAHDTPIFTPKGWTTHGELRVGDRLYAPNGRIVKVLALSDESMANWVVTTTAGDAIQCHENHEWKVYDRAIAQWVIRTTGQLARVKVWSGPVGKRGGRARFQLPEVEPLIGSKKNLAMHPYVLGAWLGDGTTGRPNLTMDADDHAVFARIAQCGFPIGKTWVHATTGCVTASFAETERKKSKFVIALEKIGVLRDKHIPHAYLTASIDQRKELLAGLIDTDGTVWQANGRCMIATVRPQLKDDIACLLRTLGIRATVAEYAPVTSSSGIVGRKTCYQISFNLPWPVPCQLERKKNPRPGAKRRIGIASVERAPKPKKGRCIQVSGDGMYLAGKYLTPTHNSTLMSVLYPAFQLGVDPSCRIMAASYGIKLASFFNNEVQDLINSERYQEVFPNTRLRPRGSVSEDMADRTQSVFRIVGHRGGLRSFGTQGSATGFSADRALIDDAHKDSAEADSEKKREAVFSFFRGTLTPRLQQGGKMAIVGTRWNERDLGSHMKMLAADPKSIYKWRVIELPAIKETPPTKDDPREIGEALWPARFGISELMERRRILGERQFNALYQQRPAPAEGSIVKVGWFKSYTQLPPRFDSQVISADLTFKDTGDYCVLTAWGVHGADRYLLGMMRDRLTFTEQLHRFVAFCQKYPQAQAKLVEEAANGAALIDTLRRHIPGIVPITARDSKQARLSAVAPIIEAGNVYVPDSAQEPWVDTFLEEFRTFPNGINDDIVDSVSQALNYIQSKMLSFSFAAESLGRTSPFALNLRI